MDTESMTLDDCQFLTYAIMRLSGSHVVSIPFEMAYSVIPTSLCLCYPNLDIYGL